MKKKVTSKAQKIQYQFQDGFAAHLGWTDMWTEGKWIQFQSYLSDKEEIEMPKIIHELWAPGEPNGKESENCMEFRQDSG